MATLTRSLLLLFISVLFFTFFWFISLSGHHSSSPSNHHQTIQTRNDLVSPNLTTTTSFQRLDPHDFKNIFCDLEPSWPLLYEKDVVMLSEKNFTDFLAKNRNVMVVFYAFWCPPCRQLAPAYAEAAEMLKGLAQLAMVDAYAETGLREKYKITEYPTMYLFINGGEKLHHFVGERNRNAITTWVKRKMAPAIYNITTMDTLVLESEDQDSEEPAAEI